MTHPIVALLAALAVAGHAGAVPTARLHASSALLDRLSAAGRAEVRARWSTPGTARAMQGSLAFEPPGRGRLDVTTTGEHVTVRADGGEWLQPATRQLLKLSPGHAAGVLRWWSVLASGRGASERALGGRAWRLVIEGEGDAARDSADVWLAANGLPERLAFDDGSGGRLEWRLSAWRFTRARGLAAFRLAAPSGYETVELP